VGRVFDLQRQDVAMPFTQQTTERVPESCAVTPAQLPDPLPLASAGEISRSSISITIFITIAVLGRRHAPFVFYM
jgi:hypothetical protein